MDPITTAIISAITAGVTKKGAEVVGKAIIDTYDGFKELISRKFGTESNLVVATKELEANPDSKGRRITLCEEVEASGAINDEDIRAAAEELLQQIKEVPGGEQSIQVAIGSYIAQADHGSTASVNVRKK